MESSRNKQTIPLEKLKEIGLATLREPSPSMYLSDDPVTVLSSFLPFFLAIAPHTKRLNASSVAIVGKHLFQMANRESKMFGDGIASAYSHCLLSGSKAATGQKLPKDVLAVYMASENGGVKSETMVKSEPKVKSETMVKSEPLSPPAKKLKACLSSPTQIASLYSASGSSVAVKVMGVCVHHRHKLTGCINMGPNQDIYTIRRHCKIPPSCTPLLATSIP
jgi:hypothetical protein